jgi:hypothetical protein
MGFAQHFRYHAAGISFLRRIINIIPVRACKIRGLFVLLLFFYLGILTPQAAKFKGHFPICVKRFGRILF